MFENVLLIAAAGGIAAYARGRGGNLIVWGTLGVGGYVVIAYLGPLIMASLGRPLDPDSRMWLIVVAAAWVGIVAFYARFFWAEPAKNLQACGPARTANTSTSSTP